ncbi:signal peptidase II [bacterium]|nr:signal peptidase II [bacterium]
MKRKDWLVVAIILLVTIIVDQLTKSWASGLSTEQNYGFIKLILVHNHGAMLGLFSELPALLRIVTLSTSGIFILCIYSLIQYIIPRRVLGLRLSLSILIGGILGNVLDRIFYGYVIDFISVQLFGWQSPIWNVADIIQWVGYIFMVYYLLKHSESLWPDQNERKTFWVNRKFQIKHSVFFTVTGLFLTLISLVFSYTYLKVTIEELVGNNPALVEKFTKPFLITYIVLALIFAIILFTVGKLISHRIAGPLYAFERFLKDILDGKGLTKTGAALTLRTNDDFKHLEDLAEQVRKKMLKINEQKTVLVAEYTDDET